MNKKSRNFIITAAIIIILVLSIIYTNSKNALVRQLQGPIEGTDGVVTVDDKVSVISKNNHIYTWQWKDLSIWPVVAKPSASVITPFTNDKIVYYSDSLNKLILTDLKAAKELGSLPLGYGAKCKKIKTSSNGKFGLASIILEQGLQKDRFKLGLFDYDFKELSYVFQKDTAAEDFLLYDFTVTNDGNFIAGSGEKNNAWIFVSDVNRQEVLWEKTFDEYDSFTLVEFSPDGKQLFVSEKVRHILMFDAESGQLLKTFVMDKYQTPSNQKQNISSIAISPDGKTLAVDTEPAGTVWFWDIATGKKIGTIYASDLTVSGAIFSPDSKYLATGCLVRPEIKIWKVPQLKP
jgi:WD40 repeat protein